MATERTPVARAAGVLLVAIWAFSGFVLLEFLALFIGALVGVGYWFMLIPVVMFGLGILALSGRKSVTTTPHAPVQDA